MKLDVTSSDGAGNGFNYEDGTFSPKKSGTRPSISSGGTPRLLLQDARPLFVTRNRLQQNILRTNGSARIYNEIVGRKNNDPSVRIKTTGRQRECTIAR